MRYNNIDILRGFAILLVVFGHVWRGLHLSGLLDMAGMFELVDSAIYLFHMPLFFFLSGLFFEKTLVKKGFSATINSRFVLLIYPLLLWSYIHFIIKYIAGELVNTPVSPIDVLYAPFPPKEQFWFLWALFLIQISLTPAVLFHRWVKPKYVMFGISVLLIGLFNFIFQNPSVLAPVIDGAVKNLPFFIAGVILAKFALTPPDNGKLAAFGVVTFVLAQLGYQWLQQETSFVISGIAASMCIFSLTIIAPWISSNFSRYTLVKGIVYIGTISFSIFLTHVIFASGSRIILAALGIENLIVHMVIGTMAGIVGPMLLLRVTKKLGYSSVLGLGR